MSSLSKISGRSICAADITEATDGIRIPRLFSLKETLDCGQAFRWEQADAEGKCWQGTAFGKILKLEESDDGILLHCTAEDFENIWRAYFDLDTDYESIKSRLSLINPVLKEAADYAPGIRILRQDPWEALCSFIISQNNNIPRIKGIISRLCDFHAENGSFPSAESLAKLSEDELADIRSGFRAKYIISGAQAVRDDPELIPSLFALPVDDARKKLMTIKGVGPKVADCTLLFGFHMMDCFPVDTWMKKAMRILLPDTDPAVFGSDAGIAQQYIFHYSRMHPDLFD